MEHRWEDGQLDARPAAQLPQGLDRPLAVVAEGEVRPPGRPPFAVVNHLVERLQKEERVRRIVRVNPMTGVPEIERLEMAEGTAE